MNDFWTGNIYLKLLTAVIYLHVNKFIYAISHWWIAYDKFEKINHVRQGIYIWLNCTNSSEFFFKNFISFSHSLRGIAINAYIKVSKFVFNIYIVLYILNIVIKNKLVSSIAIIILQLHIFFIQESKVFIEIFTLDVPWQKQSCS